MQTLQTDQITPEQLDELDKFARSDAGPELRDLLLSLSRSHLYKLLCRGETLPHRVGRDRRIRMRDLGEFEKQHQRYRRELAERFAHQRKTAAAANDEIADLL